MKILMFSSDRGAVERMRRYGEALDKLEIVFFDRAQGRFLRFFKGYFEAKKILARERFNVITAQEIEHSFLAWILSRKFKIPWQMQIHTDIFSPYYAEHSMFNRIRVWFAKFLIPRANCVRAVSERIKKSINRPDAIILPIFSNFQSPTSNFNIREKYPGYDFYILMVGRLAPEKNFKLALEVMREVIKKFNALLIIVGDGPERKRLERQAQVGLEANVRFEGWRENLADYYASADCYLLTSDYEGYGLSVIEALQAGLPVIMNDVGLAGEIVKNGENGIIVPIGNKEKIIEALLKIREDREFREKLQAGTKKTKMPYSSFEEYRDKLIDSWKICRA